MLFRHCVAAIARACGVAGYPLDTKHPAIRGLAEEVADGIVFIASDEARFITGHVLNVDGGHSAN
jgi:NAD(P)-dependent dehydrogenase (short-subunit alcohol dehydrogenase family)